MHRGAWRGWFQHDDFAHLSWTTQVRLPAFLTGLITPRFSPESARPAGNLVYAVLGRTARLDFGWGVALIQLLHVVNALLLWRLPRRMGLEALPAAAGALFFAFHMAAFDACWHPAYLYDVLCALFCLLSLESYLAGRLWLSFAAYWLAYQSKEVGVMLPAVLTCYEVWLGQRRWRRLAPFLAASASFALQSFAFNRPANSAYEFRLSAPAILDAAGFYAGELLFAPLAGFLLLGAPLIARDRRAWLGAAIFWLMIAPMLVVSERRLSVYLYESLPGAALVLAVAAQRARLWMVALFFVLWMPWNYRRLGPRRAEALDEAAQNRAYVTALSAHARKAPQTRRFQYELTPARLPDWGLEGVLRVVYCIHDPELRAIHDAAARKTIWPAPAVFLGWDPQVRGLSILSRSPGAPPGSYLAMDGATPLWQLGEGWFQLEQGYRWMDAWAEATLARPAGAKWFELVVNAGPEQMRQRGAVQVRVFVGGSPAGMVRFEREGRQSRRLALAEQPPGTVRVEFRVPDELTLPRREGGRLGAASAAFGFRQ
jgi:hypothetical protein